MPQTNKSASGGSGPVSVPDRGEPPPHNVSTEMAAGGGDVPAEDQGDPEIIKSPSDPKKYRWEKQRLV